MRIVPLWMAVLPLLATLPAMADEPTLARLCFWVGPERMEEFEAAYEEKAAPVPHQLGLVASAQRGRETVDSVFSQLFELATPEEFPARARALQHQAAWREVVRELGIVFGAAPDSVLRSSFRLYSAAVGPGKEGRASAGERQGLWQHFSVLDGMPGSVQAILQDRLGHLWIGSSSSGLSRYDGEVTVTYGMDDGLDYGGLSSLLQDRQGHLWIGTGGGVSRYDGRAFKNYTAEEAPFLQDVSSLFEDRSGDLWFGTWSGDLGRYDGERWSSGLAVLEGAGDLPSGIVQSIAEDGRGHLWFGLFGSGVVRYDGRVFQILSRRDGLIDNGVHAILRDRDDAMWIATDGGVTRYRPSTTPPAIRLEEIVADHSYGPVGQIALSTTQDVLSIAFQGRSFTTHPDQMIYVYRLQGYDKDWRQTRSDRVEYTDLPRGHYVFEVQAVDLDLNYSAAAQVEVDVHAPYGLIGLVSALALALVGLAAASTAAVRRRRQFLREEQARIQAQARLNEELEEELQTARDLQLGLMPTTQPEVEGFDLSGRCLTFNHVGGDFYQYFSPKGKLCLCLADVTGHAMQAAIPVVMFSGVLRSQMELDAPLEELFARLNRTLYEALERRTFVCFVMAELEVDSRILRLCNSGCPYPFHYRAARDEVVELELNAYPLGSRAAEMYESMEVQLEPGDWVVLCSDGFIEVDNGEGEMFGFERLSAALRRGAGEALSAVALIDYIVAEVSAFSVNSRREDDQTIVVLGAKKKANL